MVVVIFTNKADTNMLHWQDITQHNPVQTSWILKWRNPSIHYTAELFVGKNLSLSLRSGAYILLGYEGITTLHIIDLYIYRNILIKKLKKYNVCKALI